MDNRYQIIDYNQFLRNEIIQLLNDHLWFDIFEKSMEYFAYKYEQNPYRVDPIGLVVLHDKKVVGFRAFFPTKWQPGTKTENCILMLSPTDTVIHPAHRRQGLFSALIKASIKRFAMSQYQAYINLSANRAAKNGLLKFGWKLLSATTFARRYSYIGILNYYLISKLGYSSKKIETEYGRFDDIEATDFPRAKDMAEFLKKNNNSSKKLFLYKDEIYLAYRYRNPHQKYHFFYYWEKNELEGFLCARSVGNNRNVHIVDYAQKNDGILEKILDFMIRKKCFDIISIWSFGLPENIHRVFLRMNFETDTLITRIKNKSKHMQFVLVRPMKEIITDSNWLLNGEDIRNLNNWDLKELCADDA